MLRTTDLCSEGSVTLPCYMSPKTWDTLSVEDQKIFKEAAEEAGKDGCTNRCT